MISGSRWRIRGGPLHSRADARLLVNKHARQNTDDADHNRAEQRAAETIHKERNVDRLRERGGDCQQDRIDDEDEQAKRQKD